MQTGRLGACHYLRMAQSGEQTDGPHFRFTDRPSALVKYPAAARWGAWLASGNIAMLAAGCYNRIELWDTKTRVRHKHELGNHRDTVWWGSWSTVEDRPVLATGGYDRDVRLWSAGAKADHRDLSGHVEPVRWGSWDAGENGHLLATGDSAGTVRLWDTSGALFMQRSDHIGPVRWGSWGRIGHQKILATGGDDREVRLWDAETCAQFGPVLSGHQGPVLWGAWGRIGDDPVLATGGSDRIVKLWNVADPKSHWPDLECHTPTTWWGAWGEVGGQPVLATGGYGGSVELWRVADPDADTYWQSLVGHTRSVSWGAWCQVDGQPILATGGEDGTIRLWNPVNGFAYGQAPFDPAGKVLWGNWVDIGGHPYLAAGTSDGAVHLLELAEQKAVSRISSYTSDQGRSIDQPDPEDLLNRDWDLSALADVITAKSVQPPLAIGLFGQWGDGKSQFLEMLEAKVRERARAAGPADKIAHDDVRQVRFNAWHYAEADLWASLVSELFTQLSAPGDGRDVGKEHRQRSRLASELVQARMWREQLTAAQSRLDDLRGATQFEEDWDILPGSEKEDLKLILGEDRYEQISRDLKIIGISGRSFRSSFWTLFRAQRRPYLVVLVVALLLVPIIWFCFPGTVEKLVGLSGSAVAFLAGLVASAKNLSERTKPLADQLGETWKPVQDVLDRQLKRIQTAEEVAAAEVEVLQKRLRDLTAAGQLAGMVEDRASAGVYRERLGLMTQIRQDFEKMAELLYRATNETGESRDAAKDELPRIDRIVIYVDDLDRCPPSRVVEVLEAIHLLLAVRLFVVVVAVDPRWLLRSLSSHYRELFTVNADPVPSAFHSPLGPFSDSIEEERWASSPAQYLEKIFQLVLTLPPMENDSYERMINKLLGLRDTEKALTPAGGPTTSQAAATAPHDEVTQQPGAAPASDAVPPPLRQWTSQEGKASIPVIEEVDPLALTLDERRLISLLGPPLITSPRAVKRLSNSYGLLIATSNSRHLLNPRYDLEPAADHRSDRPCYPYRAKMVLLATVIGFPTLGSSFFSGLYRAARANRALTWMDYLTGRHQACQPEWLSSAISPSRAQHWCALLDALAQITEHAARHDLHLPSALPVWAEWVIPVGRLSFPTGSVVSKLSWHRS